MKNFLTIILLLSLVFLSACVNRYKFFGGLEEIKVYDEFGEEVKGEYRDYYRDSEDFFVHLNSPAPRRYFYCVPIEEGKTYYLEFKLTVRSNYAFEKIISREHEYNLEDNQYRIEGRILTLRITLNDLNLEEPYFHIDNLIYYKLDDESKKFNGSSSITVGKYSEIIRGIYFYKLDDDLNNNLLAKKKNHSYKV